jgi:hypothetical protein
MCLGLIDPNRPVVFLQHGLESSCVDWIINLPEQSLGLFNYFNSLNYSDIYAL